MTKQQTTALNMAKVIQNQSLRLLEKLNELDLDVEADLCEKRHDDAEHLVRTLSSRLDELQLSLTHIGRGRRSTHLRSRGAATRERRQF